MGNCLPLRTDADWPFVGHVWELRKLGQLLRQAEGGSGSVVLLGAPEGFGKSRFLSEVAARSSDSIVVVALASQPKGLIGRTALVDQLAATLKMVNTTRGPARVTSWQLEANALPTDACAVLEEMRALSTRRTILCIVDDLQNEDDLGFFAALVRLCWYRRIVLLTAYRSGCEAKLSLREWERSGAIVMTLPALDPVVSDTLLHLMLSVQRETADAQTKATILTISDGCPRYIEELVRRLSAVRVGNARLLPDSAEAKVAAFRDALLPTMFDLLRDSSVFGDAFSDKWLAKMAGQTLRSVITFLQLAVDMGALHELLPSRPSFFAFSDEAVRSVLYASIVTGRRLAIHARIAKLLSAVSRDGENEAQIARHWAEAGKRAQAITSLLRAGGSAAQNMRFGDALALHRRACQLAHRGSETWWDAQEQIASSLAALGEFREACSVRERLARHYTSVGNHDAAHKQLDLLMHDYWHDGRPDMADAIYRKLRVSKDEGPRALAVLGWADLRAAAGARAQASGLIKSLAASTTVPVELQLRCWRQEAYVDSRNRPIEHTMRLFETYAAVARDVGDHEEALFSSVTAANCAAELGRLDIADTWLERAQGELSEFPGDARGTVRLLPILQCELLLLHGDLERAQAALAELGLGHRFGGYWESVISGLSVFIAMRTGDASAVAAFFRPEFLDRVIRAGQAEGCGIVFRGFAETMVARGMQKELISGLHRSVAKNLVDPYFSIQLHCARYGALDDAPRAREQVAASVGCTCDAIARASVALFDAFIAKRRNYAHAARQAALAASEQYRSLQWHWMEALALETAGDRAIARELFLRCGAVRDAERVAGRTRKQQRAAFGTPLTPRENEVVSLILTGLTNRQIAARLGLSTRTVHHHVEAVFSKRGIRARWQLS